MEIKICGITNLADAELCRALGVDFIGLIRASSERQIPLARASEIAQKLAGGPQPVLLFRNAPVSEVARDVRESGVGWVQLHGAEDAAFVAQLREEAPELRLIKAVEIFPGQPVHDLGRNVNEICNTLRPDVLILDRPKGLQFSGFDDLREAAAIVRVSGVRVWCAGGLTAENVRDALRGRLFDGVDVARGVEAAPGKKSVKLAASFVKVVRDSTII